KPGDNLFLTENEPVQMGDYRITYIGDSVAAPNVFYKIQYEEIDEESGQVNKSFILKPFAQNNPQMGGLIGTPGTKHFLTHDIYTLITAAASDSHTAMQGDEQNEGAGFEQYDEPATYLVNIGDTLRYRNGYYTIEGINREATLENMPVADDDIIVGLQLKVFTAEGDEHAVEPVFLIKGGNTFDFYKDVEDQGLRFRFTKILPEENKLELMTYQKPLPEKKWVVFKAIKFPYINFFW